MKVVNITEMRQEATRVIREAQESREPILVVQRSKPAAYVIGAAEYEALQAELRDLRRAELLRDVAEAEAEVRRGGLEAYDDVDTLMAELEDTNGPDADVRSRHPS